MGDSDTDGRIIAACENCGSMYAAVESNEGEIRPIGSRTGCTSCDGTRFTSIDPRSVVTGSADADEYE